MPTCYECNTNITAGKQMYCNSCIRTRHNKKSREWQRAHYEELKDKINARKKGWREANREKYNAYHRAYYRAKKMRIH